MKRAKRILKILAVNGILLAVGIVLLELSFGGWLDTRRLNRLNLIRNRELKYKESVMSPAKISGGTGKENEDYQEQLNQMIRECKEGNALIAHLDLSTWRWYLPSKEEIESMDSTPVLRRFCDGVNMGILSSKAKPRKIVRMMRRRGGNT
ncbi:hypothetical protein ACFL01_00055 [Planctomycetota bacterium]